MQQVRMLVYTRHAWCPLRARLDVMREFSSILSFTSTISMPVFQALGQRVFSRKGRDLTRILILSGKSHQWTDFSITTIWPCMACAFRPAWQLVHCTEREAEAKQPLNGELERKGRRSAYTTSTAC